MMSISAQGKSVDLVHHIAAVTSEAIVDWAESDGFSAPLTCEQPEVSADAFPVRGFTGGAVACPASVSVPTRC